MDMGKPKTKEIEYLAFERERNNLEDYMVSGQISSNFFNRKYLELVERYKG